MAVEKFIITRSVIQEIEVEIDRSYYGTLSDYEVARDLWFHAMQAGQVNENEESFEVEIDGDEEEDI